MSGCCLSWLEPGETEWHDCIHDDIAHECPHECECGATFDRLELTTPELFWSKRGES